MTSAPSSPIVLADFLDIVETALATVSPRLPAHVGRDDLASAGKLALVALIAQASGPSEEVRAWCFVRVRGAMLDELRRLDPLPRNRRDQAKAVALARSTLAARLGRAPTDDEVAAATRLPAAAVRAAAAALAAEAEVHDIEWSTVPDTASPSPVESVEQTDLHAGLRAALDRLPANQAAALRRYYLEDATLDEIAAELGVSRERARQVREAGEKKLRADLLVLSLWQGVLQTRN
ncbi:MAG TPA: sigma-70 family RNA polymerase sigma factor [Lacunisphaera sp.]|nr:sigma-70 family RNA polymerase sigma factor [Lacunisphaera sp.]